MAVGRMRLIWVDVSMTMTLCLFRVALLLLLLTYKGSSRLWPTRCSRSDSVQISHFINNTKSKTLKLGSRATLSYVVDLLMP